MHMYCRLLLIYNQLKPSHNEMKLMYIGHKRIANQLKPCNDCQMVIDKLQTSSDKQLLSVYTDLMSSDNHLMSSDNHLMSSDNHLMATYIRLMTIDDRLMTSYRHPKHTARFPGKCYA
jgi:DNA repair ATPase RecN